MNPVKRIVIDTSSLVSAVLRPNSVPRQAFLAAIKDHDLCVCQSTLDELLEVLQRSKDWHENARKKIATNSAFSQIPIRLWKQLTDFIGDKNWADSSKAELRKLAGELTEGVFMIQGRLGAKWEAGKRRLKITGLYSGANYHKIQLINSKTVWRCHAQKHTFASHCRGHH